MTDVLHTDHCSLYKDFHVPLTLFTPTVRCKPVRARSCAHLAVRTMLQYRVPYRVFYRTGVRTAHRPAIVNIKLTSPRTATARGTRIRSRLHDHHAVKGVDSCSFPSVGRTRLELRTFDVAADQLSWPSSSHGQSHRKRPRLRHVARQARPLPTEALRRRRCEGAARVGHNGYDV